MKELKDLWEKDFQNSNMRVVLKIYVLKMLKNSQ